MILERGGEGSGKRSKANLEGKWIHGLVKGSPLMWVQEAPLETGERGVNEAIAELNDGTEIPRVKETGTVQNEIDHVHVIIIEDYGMMIQGEAHDGTMMRGTPPLRGRGECVTRSWSDTERFRLERTTMGEETGVSVWFRRASTLTCIFCLDIPFLVCWSCWSVAYSIDRHRCITLTICKVPES